MRFLNILRHFGENALGRDIRTNTVRKISRKHGSILKEIHQLQITIFWREKGWENGYQDY
jgi:hypothetical protein